MHPESRLSSASITGGAEMFFAWPLSVRSSQRKRQNQSAGTAAFVPTLQLSSDDKAGLSTGISRPTKWTWRIGGQRLRPSFVESSVGVSNFCDWQLLPHTSTTECFHSTQLMSVFVLVYHVAGGNRLIRARWALACDPEWAGSRQKLGLYLG